MRYLQSPRISRAAIDRALVKRISTSASKAKRRLRGAPSKWATGALVATATLAGVAAFVNWRSRQADRANPPRGRFITVDGVKLHYVDRGTGPPLIFLHGNGSLSQELEASGLIERCAQRYRVIAFDRPGFGFSERPAGRSWTAREQAALFSDALAALGIEQATVLGHSWGTLVALALALDHPSRVRSLVLVSGYYFPTFRPGALFLSTPAWPGVGPLLSNTTSPLLARAMWRGLLRIAFGPPRTPEPFERLPKWTLLRPSRLRAAAQESGMLAAQARQLAPRYRELRMPIAILAGKSDRIVNPRRHAERLHSVVAHSDLWVLPELGHMLHHNSPESVLRAVDSMGFGRSTRVAASQQAGAAHGGLAALGLAD